MVATRRGVRVCSPVTTKTNSDESPDVQATPSSAHRTRRAAKQSETSEEESRNQPRESSVETVPSPQHRRSIRRCTKHSRLHSPPQPSTPADSDMESGCSALSDSEAPPDGVGDGKARHPRTASQEEEAGSEAESCSSPAPEKRRARRSVRARKSPERPCTSQSDGGEQEAATQRATRSSRRSTRARASAKTPGESAEVSDADSCASGAPEGPPSTARATRSGRRAPLCQPIPLHLDAASEGSESPARRSSRGRPPRGVRGNTPSDVSCDSEGLESGPSTPSRQSTRIRAGSLAAAAPATDSDSEVLQVTLVQSRAARLSVVLERVVSDAEEPGVPMEGTEAQPAGSQSPLNESKLEVTVVDEADCTVVEDKTIIMDDEEEEIISIGREGGVAVSVAPTDVVMEDAVEAPSVAVEAEGVVGEASGENEDVTSSAGGEVTADDQQREPPQDGEGDALPTTQEELPTTQEELPTTQEELPQPTPEDLPQTPVQAEPEAALPPSPPPHSEEPIEIEDMEVDASGQEGGSDQATAPETEQAEDPAIQVASSQDPKVRVEAVPEPAPEGSDVLVQPKAGVISLLPQPCSDADSCASGAPGGPPATARATRSTRRAPLCRLDTSSEGSQSPARRSARRPVRGNTSSDLSYDSEGFESGPSAPSRRSTRSRAPAPAPATDSEDMEVDASGPGAQQEAGSDRATVLEPEQAEDPAIQVTSGQDPKVRVEAVPEPAPQRSDVLVQPNAGVISLLPQPTPEELPQQTPEELPQPTPEELPQPTPEELPQPTPEELPQPTPEELPQPTPEELPQPTPEELPQPTQATASEPEQAEDPPIQVTSSQDPKVRVEAVPEHAPQRSDVLVQPKTRVISLLDSSSEEEEEDDDEEDDDCVIQEEEEEEDDDDKVEIVEPGTTGSSELPDDQAGASGLFMVDKRPGQEADLQYLKKGGEGGEEEDEDDFVDEEGDEEDDEYERLLFTSSNRHTTKGWSTRIDTGLRAKELGGLYINFDGSKSKPVSNSLQKLKQPKIQDEAMKNSVIGPEFEKQSAALPYKEGKRSLKLKRKEERDKTTGDGWFNMKAPELTPELRTDLKIIKMRGALDSKRFYKKSDREGLPKFFQVGTVVDSHVDFYHSRIPKKDRKRTMAEELLADTDFRRKNKKKYMDIMAEKTAAAAGRSKKKRFNQKKPAAV